MAFTRWLKPGQLPQLGGWDLWHLRDVGGWGDLGRRVGARWEQVGGSALCERFGDSLVELWRDRSLTRWLGTLGVPNPDALLVERGGDERITLRPVDLKWSLDTANYSQIAGERLRQLLLRGADRLSPLLPPSTEPPRLGDGLFLAPERPLNRLYLASDANRAREYPLEAREVLFVSVDPAAFYSPLPGWDMARRIARLEGAEGLDRDLELANRYYHIGVGIWGALLTEGRSVFAEREPLADEQLLEVDPEEEAIAATRLEAFIAETGAADARDLVRTLARSRTQRDLLRADRRTLERLPYRFGELRTDARGHLSDHELRMVHRELTRWFPAELRRLGRELLSGGLSEAQAMERLREQADDLKLRARTKARQLLRAL